MKPLSFRPKYSHKVLPFNVLLLAYSVRASYGPSLPHQSKRSGLRVPLGAADEDGPDDFWLRARRDTSVDPDFWLRSRKVKPFLVKGKVPEDVLVGA